MTNLIEWLEERDGFLLYHSPIYNKSAVAAVLHTQRNFSGSPFLVMTNNINNFRKYHPYPAEYIRDDMFVTYERPRGKTNKVLAAGLQTGAYIVVDDVDQLIAANMMDIFETRHDKTKIIILFTIYSRHIDQISSIQYLNRMDIVTLNLTNELPMIDFKTMKTGMTRDQTKHYNDNRDQRNIIGNFYGPFDIQTFKDEWITPTMIPMLSHYSRKLQQMLSIILQSDATHLVYTHSEDCARLIHLLLNQINQSSRIIDDSDSKEDVHVVITTRVDCNVENIGVIHFLEGLDFDSFSQLLSNVVNLHNYNKQIELVSVYFHQADINKTVINGLSFDANHFNKVRDELRERIKNHHYYNDECPRLYTSGKNGMHVE